MNKNLEMSDGGVIEAPNENGTIRRRDQHGDLVDFRSPGDEGYMDLFKLFPVIDLNYYHWAVPTTDDDGNVRLLTPRSDPMQDEYSLDGIFQTIAEANQYLNEMDVEIEESATFFLLKTTQEVVSRNG
jgi:hypothetical protein